MRKFGLGIVGCGSISERYFAFAALSSIVEVVSCSSSTAETALRMANRFGVKAVSYDEMLGDETIDLVVNLTPPAAHWAVSQQALSAGKHVYSEKPLAASLDEARKLVALAAELGLRVGCAPDTFFGAAHQVARRAIDDGAIGSVLGGAIVLATRGMESWHSNPSFFFKPGGGPLLDVGPYYLSQAINLLGPVRAVWSRALMGYAERIWESEVMTNRLPHKVVIHLTDGRSLAREVLWPRGTLGLNALTHEELNSKIMSRMALAPDGTVAAAKAILADPTGTADELMAVLGYESKGRA